MSENDHADHEPPTESGKQEHTGEPVGTQTPKPDPLIPRMTLDAGAGSAAARLSITEPTTPIPVTPTVEPATAIAAGSPAAPPPSPDTGAEAPPFMSVSNGDTFDGMDVDFIYGADDNYIVFESQGRLLYQTTDAVPFKRQALDAFREFMARAQSELEGAYWSQTRNLLGSALARAFDADSTDAVTAAFRSVEKFITAHTPLRRLFGRTPAFVVFMDATGMITWDYPQVPAPLLPAIAEFENSIQVAATVLADSHQLAVKQILGNELTVAFRSGPNVAPLSEVFAASRDFIAKHVQSSVTNSYVIASLIVAAVFGICLLACVTFPPTFIVHDARVLAFGALAGVIGACISVLQRSSTLVVTPFAPKSQMIVQSVVRMALGIVFGVLVIIAVKGNVAFGTFKANNDMLFLLAVAAGFSERLIPDLLTNLTQTANGAAASAPGPKAPAPTGKPSTTQNSAPPNTTTPNTTTSNTTTP